jgi:DNA-binding NarL/FixJ family response regulator
MARLTKRERDVVRLTADGMRNQEIALNLHLSEHTVRNYMIKIFDKLGISSLFRFGMMQNTCWRAKFVAVIKNGNDSDVDNVIAFGFDWSRPTKLPDCRLRGSYP